MYVSSFCSFFLRFFSMSRAKTDRGTRGTYSAHNFHKKSYEDRIVEQKFQINALVSLYLKFVLLPCFLPPFLRLTFLLLSSRDIGRSDTLDGGSFGRPKNKRQVSDPTLLVKQALKGAKKVAQTATTVIGTVASEIAGERVLQPNSPASMVTAALQSTNKTKHLARRIYYSFCPQYRDGLVLADISRCFRNMEETERVRFIAFLPVFPPFLPFLPASFFQTTTLDDAY